MLNLIGLLLISYSFSEEALQEASLIITENSIYPTTLVVYPGQKLRIYATSTSNKPACLKIPQGNAQIRVLKGKLSIAEMPIPTEAMIDLGCPGDARKGKIIVRGLYRKNQSGEENKWFPKED